MNPEPGLAYCAWLTRTSLPFGVGTSERDGRATPPSVHFVIPSLPTRYCISTHAWSLFAESAPIEYAAVYEIVTGLPDEPVGIGAHWYLMFGYVLDIAGSSQPPSKIMAAWPLPSEVPHQSSPK